MSIRNTNSYLLPLLILIITSCHPRESEFKPEKVKNRKTEDLVRALDSLGNVRPDHFYSRIKTVYADTNRTVSFRTSLRMTKDSAVSALITKASIPVAQAMVRPDSVLIHNKMSNCMIQKDLSYFKEAFGVDFSYVNIEELILGLPIDFDTTQRYFQINDNYSYIISSKKKREVRRELRNDGVDGNTNNNRDKDKDKDKEKDKEKENRERENRERERRRREEENPIIIQYYLNADLSAVNRIFIDSPADSTNINIQYLSRDSVDIYLIPADVQIDIKTPRNNVYIELKYEKTVVNVPEEIVFVIPEDYEVCGTEE